jgi:hypothetical protein
MIRYFCSVAHSHIFMLVTVLWVLDDDKHTYIDKYILKYVGNIHDSGTNIHAHHRNKYPYGRHNINDVILHYFLPPLIIRKIFAS